MHCPPDRRFGFSRSRQTVRWGDERVASCLTCGSATTACFRQCASAVTASRIAAASFALIAYASSWMKCHHADVFLAAIFLAAILNAQPMGFYRPAQLVRDARGLRR